MPAGAVAAVVPNLGRYARAATAGLATLGAATAHAGPMQADTRPAVFDAAADAVPVVFDAVAREPVDDAARFQRVRSGILAGRLIKPSLRAIYAAEGASRQVAARYLSDLERAGVIERTGRGFALTAHNR